MYVGNGTYHNNQSKCFQSFVAIVDREFPQIFEQIRFNFTTTPVNKGVKAEFISFNDQMYNKVAILVNCDRYQSLDDFQKDSTKTPPQYIVDFMMRKENYGFLKFKYAL